MLVTLLGIVTLVSQLQPENAEDPIIATLFGIVTFVSPLQPENAEDPMPVTLSGIVTPVSPLQPENAEGPMPRTPVRFKSPEREPVLPIAQPSTNTTPGIVVVSKSESLQPENASVPMLVTLFGIVTLVSPLQP